MTKDQQKKYILKTWKNSSGKRITEMLKRYWGVSKKSGEDMAKVAKDIFFS